MSNTGSYSAVFTRGQLELLDALVASSSRRAPHSASARDAPALVASRRVASARVSRRRTSHPCPPLSPPDPLLHQPPPPARQHGRALSCCCFEDEATHTRGGDAAASAACASARGRRRSRGRPVRQERGRQGGHRSRSRCKQQAADDRQARARRGLELVTDLTLASPSYRSSERRTSARAAHERPSHLAHSRRSRSVFLPLAYHYTLTPRVPWMGTTTHVMSSLYPLLFSLHPSAAFATTASAAAPAPPRPLLRRHAHRLRARDVVPHPVGREDDERTSNDLRRSLRARSPRDAAESPSVRRRKRRRQRNVRTSGSEITPTAPRCVSPNARLTARPPSGAAPHARGPTKPIGPRAPPRRPRDGCAGARPRGRLVLARPPPERNPTKPVSSSRTDAFPASPRRRPRDYSVSARREGSRTRSRGPPGCRRRWRTRRRRPAPPPRRRCIRPRCSAALVSNARFAPRTPMRAPTRGGLAFPMTPTGV